MNYAELVSTLSKQKVLPIFRGSHVEIEAALALMEPLEFNAIELTTSIPNWQLLLKELSQKYQVGLGTVTSNQDIEDAITYGAKFLVSFGSFPDLIEATKKIPVIPGALTPSEFLQFQRAGIKLAKLYPASAFGAKYLKDLKILLPDMQFIATGGIGVNAEELKNWRENGAIAIGMGSALGNPISDEAGFKQRVVELKSTLQY
jgi:2-dehydro-3-deoxyphosphogluconate aldolase/(4S)-4-hydroxy-2-oxoglutarate aldolase